MMVGSRMNREMYTYTRAVSLCMDWTSYIVVEAHHAKLHTDKRTKMTFL